MKTGDLSSVGLQVFNTYIQMETGALLPVFVLLHVLQDLDP